MIAIIGLFIILILSLTVVRIGAIALELTGLSTDVAAFQAQSGDNQATPFGAYFPIRRSCLSSGNTFFTKDLRDFYKSA